MSIYVYTSRIITAFRPTTIGTKVVDRDRFMDILIEAIASHDSGKDSVPGQHFIMLPESALVTICAGVGNRTANPDDYVVREHSGVVSAYLKREKAAKPNGCAVMVCTYDAYRTDDEEDGWAAYHSEATHVLVAVLGYAGPKAQLSPRRFVANLAGGNNEALMWSGDEIRERARDIEAYDQEWVVVAD